MKAPHAIAVHPSGLLVITDTNSKRLLFVTSSGTLVGSISLPDQPRGVVCDEQGFIYVALSLTGEVRKYDLSGHLIAVWNARGDANGVIYGITYDNGEIYVADTFNNRVPVFDTFGNAQRAITTQTQVGPYGVAVVGDQLLVTDSKAVVAYNKQTGELLGIYTPTGQAWIFGATPILGGELIVTDQHGRHVLRYAPSTGTQTELDRFADGVTRFSTVGADGCTVYVLRMGADNSSEVVVYSPCPDSCPDGQVCDPTRDRACMPARACTQGSIDQPCDPNTGGSTNRPGATCQMRGEDLLCLPAPAPAALPPQCAQRPTALACRVEAGETRPSTDNEIETECQSVVLGYGQPSWTMEYAVCYSLCVALTQQARAVTCNELADEHQEPASM